MRGRSGRWTVAACFVSIIAGPERTAAQFPDWLRSYYLNVPLWSDATSFHPGGVSDLQRLRVMVEPMRGSLTLDVAYENLFTYTARAGAGAFGFVAAPGGNEFLDLQWTISDSDHADWRHRFDRLNLQYAGSQWQATVGRQTISWATTLLLTPADPFVPFDPADPFREYRAGVDAARVQFYPGPLTEFEVVARGSDAPTGETATLLGRGKSVLFGWEVSGWTGVLHDDVAVGVGASGGIGQVAVRSEAALRKDNGDVVIRGTVGVDTRFELFGRDLYTALEYQHDGFGTSTSDELTSVIQSQPFVRGELQTLGRDVTAGQASYQVHPLTSMDVLVLWNLNDPSALIAPGLSYSLSNEASARAGLFLGVGDGEIDPDELLPSEFGSVPVIVYGSLSVFF